MARVKVTCGEEEVVLNTNSGFSVKSLDCQNKKSISVVDWYAAAHIVEERICFYHSNAQVEVLTMYHKVVMDLGHPQMDSIWGTMLWSIHHLELWRRLINWYYNITDALEVYCIAMDE